MYTPAAFRVEDPDWILGHVERHDFGMLVSADPLMVSHLPFHLVRPKGDQPAQLLCHVARANPHWRCFEGQGAPALAVFRGPHAYVSPTWYGQHPSVPTWNYDVVQAEGIATLIENPAEIAIQMRAMAAAYEPTPGFDMDAQPQKYMEGMFKALVGIRLTVRHWTGKRKQSQNRPEADRIMVARALEARGDHDAAAALREANDIG
ncbi:MULTISPECIES: FMN-binding negative transcriptional regulator [Roseomonadaceae]|uniref:FMN-binding negative transcriptional regulator n=1 Tax=Falsiroseomonas oleicola TaxID=2801474 RepID=A0ABS6H5X3_9PROT|nr:FMN-binding negative transcriptional regulator [Roseomonas oleicola]MBU8543403.1 FMN-binding negative transcriptional regulator [Roseomonas oleicola]